jgi:NTE family protein
VGIRRKARREAIVSDEDSAKSADTGARPGPAVPQRAAPPPVAAGGSGIGLALGGGGARGLAHIIVLETFDELGVRPDMVAGTSIGAILGAAYCAGMSGADIREYCVSLFSNRTQVFRRVLNGKNGKLFALWTPRRPAMFDPVVLLEALMPDAVNCDFADLRIPLRVMTSDFYTQSEFIIESGPVLPAVAASSALPGLLKPVRIEGRVLIDGGFVNPLPFDALRDRSDFTVAVDVSTGPEYGKSEIPSALEAILGSTQITLNSILAAKLRAGAPDALIRPNVAQYRVLDFFKIKTILEESAPIRDELKRALEAYLNRATV